MLMKVNGEQSNSTKNSLTVFPYQYVMKLGCRLGSCYRFRTNVIKKLFVCSYRLQKIRDDFPQAMNIFSSGHLICRK